jgi:hypothetical protein
LNVESRTEWKLLREHLKGHKIWRQLSSWKAAYANHMDNRILAQCKAVEIIEKTTGYKLVDRDNTPPLLYSYTTGEIFFKSTLKRAFDINDKIDFEKDITTDSVTGDIKFRKGTILGTVPGNEVKCKADLLAALHLMDTIPELPEIVDTYNELKKVTKTTKEKFELIWQVGFVPGKCNVCEQLGI